VKRQFVADRPDRVWFTDITQHRAGDGWVYCCAVIDATDCLAIVDLDDIISNAKQQDPAVEMRVLRQAVVHY
jgi:transposase InsO family protein